MLWPSMAKPFLTQAAPEVFKILDATTKPKTVMKNAVKKPFVSRLEVVEEGQKGKPCQRRREKRHQRKKDHRLQNQICQTVDFENAHLRKNRRKHLRKDAPRNQLVNATRNKIIKKSCQNVFASIVDHK